MKAIELAGIAIHAGDPDEIRAALARALAAVEVSAMAEDDQYLFSECAHAIGHLAWRFRMTDPALLTRVVALGRAHAHHGIVAGGMEDMWSELESFVPEAQWRAVKG